MRGYDTTANTTIYTCVVLAVYTDIQQKARQEVDSVYAKMGGSDDRELSYSKHFHSFHYLVALMVRTFQILLDRDSTIAHCKGSQRTSTRLCEYSLRFSP
jgi:cytochrome P450